MNKKLIASAAMALFFLSTGLAQAESYRHPPRYERDYEGSREEMGRVLDVIPVYEVVRNPVTERECRPGVTRRYRERGSDPAVGTIAGGLIGGVIGNQFGQGSGNTAMTIAGTALGAAIGNDASRDRGETIVEEYDEPRCDEVTRHEERREVVGYRVKYRYQGDIYWTRTDREPGEFIRVDSPRRSERW